MICIYCIRNKIDGKVYIGKTRNFKTRVSAHKRNMQNYHPYSSNRHLYNSCQKYGISSFEFLVIESFEEIEEGDLSEREMYWMLHFKSTDRAFGYNLRMDSSSRCIVHPETIALQKENASGESNPNYGNKWSDEMKKTMSNNAKTRHASGRYGESWRKKISEASREMWKDENIKRRMAESVSAAKQKYNFLQYTKDGEFVREWGSIKEIVSENPCYKWQNIYSVCNGYKKTYMGFVWKKQEKEHKNHVRKGH